MYVSSDAEAYKKLADLGYKKSQVTSLTNNGVKWTAIIDKSNKPVLETLDDAKSFVGMTVTAGNDKYLLGQPINMSPDGKSVQWEATRLSDGKKYTKTTTLIQIANRAVLATAKPSTSTHTGTAPITNTVTV